MDSRVPVRGFSVAMPYSDSSSRRKDFLQPWVEHISEFAQGFQHPSADFVQPFRRVVNGAGGNQTYVWPIAPVSIKPCEL